MFARVMTSKKSGLRIAAALLAIVVLAAALRLPAFIAGNMFFNAYGSGCRGHSSPCTA